MQQAPCFTIAPVEGSVNITCSTSEALSGIYLKQLWPQSIDIIYYEDEVMPTVNTLFRDRVNFSGSQDKLTITMHHLQPVDTGTYTCEGVTETDVFRPHHGTLVLVTGREFARPGPLLQLLARPAPQPLSGYPPSYTCLHCSSSQPTLSPAAS
ncbi:T-cell antigen cd7 [Saguinus oedipus]|uniref:T-cell antigen cd7 n=1 Tax=Saguinus oedipus TaxID=9490 RepID=A0ABQ9VV47_SAGOE|nr:T-cell antigen cd7 [Saguinus oedipus]